MRKKLLQRISLASAMALCTQSLLSMENMNPFPDGGQPNMNRGQVYPQQYQPQIQQQPQFPGNLQRNTINWMNTAPQNQVIPLPSEYVNTPNGLYVINKVTFHEVHPVQQPQQYIPMPMFQNQQSPMPLGAYPGNQWCSQGSMNTRPQQGPYIHQNQFFQPGLQNNDADTQQGAEGAKRKFEQMGSNKKAEPQKEQKRQKQEAKKLTRMEMNVHKMLLLKAYMNTMDIPEDVSNIIKRNLHDVTRINPVLDGKLTYALPNGEKATFNINNLVKDGCIDLSNEIFGDTSKYLLITTEPEQFFSIKTNSDKLVMLIAPRFLIEQKIESSAEHFKPIIDSWKEEQAPIGIFWRMECWANLGWYSYLTSEDVTEISKNNLFELLRRARSAGLLGAVFTPVHYPAFKVKYAKLHVHFVN